MTVRERVLLSVISIGWSVATFVLALTRQPLPAFACLVVAVSTAVAVLWYERKGDK